MQCKIDKNKGLCEYKVSEANPPTKTIIVRMIAIVNESGTILLKRLLIFKIKSLKICLFK